MSLHDTGPGHVFRAHRRGIAWTLLLLLLTLLAGVGLLGLAGHFLIAAALAGSAAGSFNLFGPSAGIRALTFARILSRYGERLVGHSVTLALARDLRVWFFRRALPLAPLGLGRFRTGDLLARLMADIEAVDGRLVRAIGPLLALACLAVIACAVALCVLPVAGVALTLAMIAIAVLTPCMQRWTMKSTELARAQARSEFRQTVMESLEGASDVWAFGGVDAVLRRADARSRELSACELSRKRGLMWGAAAHGVVAALLLPVMAGVLLSATAGGGLGAAAAGGVFFMTVATLEAMAGVGLAWQSWQASRASLERLREITAAAPALPEGVALPSAEAALELMNVELAWPGQPRPVLRDLNLTLRPGQRVALRGDSGAGKSSLMALLLRLRAPDRGSVRFGGQDLSAFAIDAWHRRIAWLPQEAPVFAGSVRENLRMGDPQADDARLWWALETVQLEALVRGWSRALDMWLGESGATLSAGQARRLALARALLRDAPLWLFDEPTEGLDVDTADAVCRALAAASQGRSVLIITHGSLPAGTVDESWRLIDGRLWREPAEDVP